MEKDRIIECIAQENWEHFCEAIEQTKEARTGKKIIIFGAGVLGMQFAYTLELQRITEFLFCDNNPTKWGTSVCKRTVISPMELEGKKDRYYIFIAIENYYDCMKQMEELGYCTDEEIMNLKNCSERKLVKDFREDMNASSIIMGDCFLCNISFCDKMKTSLAELLHSKDIVKVMALNGIYMRMYYNLLLMCLDGMETVKKVNIMLGVDIFASKYPLYTKNQHVNLFKVLRKISGSNLAEIDSFEREIEKRAEGSGIIDDNSVQRTEHQTKKEIEQGCRIYFKLNYLYKLSEDTESIQYLDRMLEECRSREIEINFIIMPVNYEVAEKYFGSQFYERYEANVQILKRHIENGKGKCIDLSYFLKKDDFIWIKNLQEGIKEEGRKKIAEEVRKII